MKDDYVLDEEEVDPLLFCVQHYLQMADFAVIEPDKVCLWLNNGEIAIWSKLMFSKQQMAETIDMITEYFGFDVSLN